MASLAALIRLRQFQLDEKRRLRGELQELADSLAAEFARLEAEMAAEAALAAGDGALMADHGRYRLAALERRRRLEESRDGLERRIEAVTEEIRDAFRDLKTLELTEAERARREAQKQRRREEETLDEIGLETFRRRADTSAAE